MQQGLRGRWSKKSDDPMDVLASRVADKLGEGDYKGAVHLACGSDSVAEHSPETLVMLKQKHPDSHPDCSIIPAPDAELCSIAIKEEDVRRAIVSFPNGSAGGPDGLRPQHLKDLTSPSANEGGSLLLRALTSLVTLILRGKTPEQIRPFFFGAKLVALRKKLGGVRPIAVGCTLRRLAAKCASALVRKELPELLTPRQLGFGVPLGVDAAVHAARAYLRDLHSDQVIMKVDFKNAFNSIRRDKMLLAVEEFIPELLPFVHSAYSKPSSLMWGNDVLQSLEGVQQGDPLGPLLFCLSIHKMCAKLKSELAGFFLDDGTLGGYWEDVIDDLKLIEEEASDVGLQLNRSKTELFCSDSATRSKVLSTFPGVRVVEVEDAELLGSPLGSATSVNACVGEKIELLKLMGERLHHLHSHDAIILLRHSFAIPKMMHLLRTSPCFDSPRLQVYDDLLRSILSNVTNIRFEENDSSWLQATLPVNMGGLGIRSAVHLAPSAFLASADGSLQLVRKILPPTFQSTPEQEQLKVRDRWGADLDDAPPVQPESSRMKAWDMPRVINRANFLLSSTNNAKSRARLLAVSTKESGAWLKALPISSLGLRLDDESLRIAIGLRLGCQLSLPHICVHCGEDVDQYATHGLSYKWSQGRHSRHGEINGIIHRSLVSAKVPSRLEPTDLLRSDAKRPDGMSIIPWSSGRLLVWDATCCDTFAASNIHTAVTEPGAVAAHAENIKVSKYSHLDSSYLFVPVAVETCGAFGPNAQDFLRDLGRRVKTATLEDNAYQYLVQRISVAVQRGNAASVLGSLGDQSCGLGDF